MADACRGFFTQYCKKRSGLVRINPYVPPPFTPGFLVPPQKLPLSPIFHFTGIWNYGKIKVTFNEQRDHHETFPKQTNTMELRGAGFLSALYGAAVRSSCVQSDF